MEEHLLPVVKHEFPLKVVIGEEIVIFNTPEDVPPDTYFRLYEEPKEVAKGSATPVMINTGKARTWNNNAVD
jgi:hypothetical protein